MVLCMVQFRLYCNTFTKLATQILLSLFLLQPGMEPSMALSQAAFIVSIKPRDCRVVLLIQIEATLRVTSSNLKLMTEIPQVFLLLRNP